METDVTIPPLYLASQLVAGGVAVLLPVVLILLARKKLGGRWRVVFWGAAVFAASQLVTRIPLVALLQGNLQSVIVDSATAKWLWILGLSFSAGLFEEVGRWLGYRYLIPQEPRTTPTAVLFGLGHGGLESIVLVGFGLIASALVMPMVLQTLDQLPEEARAQMIAEIRALSEVPGWTPLLAAWERAGSLAVHVSMSVLVLQAFVRRGGAWWVVAAIVFHGLSNLAPVAILEVWGRTDPTVLVITEVVITAFAAVGLWIAWRLHRAPESRRNQEESCATS